MMLAQNEYTSPSSRRAALLGALPFLVFGLSSMLTKTEMHALFPTVDIQSGYFFLGFYLLALVGLLVGWIKGFKRWAYAYLGWAIIFAAWWSNASIEGLKILGYTFSNNELLGWRSWFPMGVVALLAIAWTHSLRPIKQFFLGIWNDWTRLSFTLFTFVAWLALIYDENHHPYLLLFMLGSTLSAAVGAYIYARLGNALLRILCLIIGTLSALGFDWVCDATWDFSAYYHLPLVQEPWYLTVLRWSAGMGFIALFLLGPAILALLRKGIHRMRV